MSFSVKTTSFVYRRYGGDQLRFGWQLLRHPSRWRGSAFIQLIYHCFLGRAADTGGLANYLQMLSRHRLRGRWQALRCILSSEEYGHRLIDQCQEQKLELCKQHNLLRKLPLPSALFNAFSAAHHRARCEMVAQQLPNASRVLDLGGGSSSSLDGGLFERNARAIPLLEGWVKRAIVDRR